MGFSDLDRVRPAVLLDDTRPTDLFRTRLACKLFPFPLGRRGREKHRAQRPAARGVLLPEEIAYLCLISLNRQVATASLQRT